MIPTNNNEEGCSPISSNCVVWQGPDIPCIELCKGDTVTNVVYKLATQLCDLLDRLNIDTFDLSCFNITDCQPEDFKGLIQLLIDRICELENIDQTEATGEMGCPDCEVSVCDEFYYNTPQGDLATTMQLKDYVLAIGNTVCGIIGQIDTINETLQQIGDDIGGGTEPTPSPSPEITPVCVLPSIATDIEIVLQELEVQFCEQKTILGGSQDLITALQAACAGLSTDIKLNGTGAMDTIPGWFSTPSNVAQSMSNMWKTICDLRDAVKFLQSNIDLTCNAVVASVTATMIDSTTIRLTFTGSMPNNFSDTPTGSTITLSNLGGLPQTVNNVLIKQDHIDAVQPLDISLSNNVNGTLNVTADVIFRVSDPVQGYDCETPISAVALGTNTCPTITVNPSFESVDFSFPWSGASTFITVELYDTTGTTLIQSTVVQSSTPTTSGNFTGLTDGTPYKIRIYIDGTPCEFFDFATLALVCTAPTLGAVDINYIQLTGDQDASTIAAWVAEYESYFGPITP